MSACPICRKAEADPKYRPFCSRRCRDRDLGAWLTDSYSVAGEPVDPASIIEAEEQD